MELVSQFRCSCYYGDQTTVFVYDGLGGVMRSSAALAVKASTVLLVFSHSNGMSLIFAQREWWCLWSGMLFWKGILALSVACSSYQTQALRPMSHAVRKTVDELRIMWLNAWSISRSQLQTDDRMHNVSLAGSFSKGRRELNSFLWPPRGSDFELSSCLGLIQMWLVQQCSSVLPLDRCPLSAFLMDQTQMLLAS